jgi:hypothetical protein
MAESTKGFDWSWSWEYRISQVVGITPISLLFVFFGWVPIALQLFGILGIFVFSRRDLDRMRRDAQASLKG